MNYRHHYHAGNFADVMKHALLVQIARALQKKEKGFLVLDTHAGQGAYDLEAASVGDSLQRTPEWPDGIGRLIEALSKEADRARDWPASSSSLVEYLDLVREFDRRSGNAGAGLRYYPGSPSLMDLIARPQDRLLLFERHPEEAAALKQAFRLKPDVLIKVGDGYTALKSLLPPPEKRALVLMDPPFEAQDEWAQIVAALKEGLRRFPSGVYAVWYPLTERAKVDFFFEELQTLDLPATVAVELAVDPGALKMKGCGLLVVNPPWQFAHEAEATVKFLAQVMARGRGARGDVIWLVAEK